MRTIAVDPKVIPYGSTLYIPDARGTEVTLPDGTKVTHDGYFFAADAGGLIKGIHIDVFVGTTNPYTKNPFPKWLRSSANGSFKAYIVKDPTVSTSLKSLH